MSRREFRKSVKLQIIKRAMVMGEMRCENCGVPVFPGKTFEIDHRDPDAMQIDKSKPLTVDDGWILCKPCHKEKTSKDMGDIAKAKRREAAHLGARRPKQPLPKGPNLRGPQRKHEGRESLPPKRIYEEVSQ